MGVSPREYKTPASIALGVMETHKLPHHDKVRIPPQRQGTNLQLILVAGEP